MLARRRIELNSAGSLRESVISREVLEDCGRVVGILERAHRHADTILDDAAARRDRLLAECERDFWQRAGGCLEHWEQQRQEMCAHIETHASAVVEQAVARALNLAEPRHRLEGMVAELTAARLDSTQATLCCNAEQKDEVDSILASRSTVAWRVIASRDVAVDELRLETDNGHFDLSWATVKQAMNEALCSD